MAENTTKNSAKESSVVAPSAVASNGATPPQKCDVLGCIAHGSGSTMNQKTQVLTKYVVHFRTNAEIMQHAIESMNREVALLARKGEGLPSNRVVDIYEDLSFTKTIDDEIDAISKLSADERMKLEQQLMLRLEALKKSQTLSYAS